jgi:hypothetical protein
MLSALALPVQAADVSAWVSVQAEALQPHDDDIARNTGRAGFFNGIEISEYRFSENGFDWHIIRFANTNKPEGPLWMVPHDDENAAFDAMITAVKEHGGVGLAVNSGAGSSRTQQGNGVCGVRAGTVTKCDPNRNFDAATPTFTAAFLNQRPDGQPVIALHTNSHGFSGDGSGGRGDITILDRAAYQRGVAIPRQGGLFAVRPKPDMANYDTLGLAAFLAPAGKPSGDAAKCGQALANAGIHFWHEPVRTSDGSMSNYLVLNYPEIQYFNAESRAEIDLSVAAARHGVMVMAYLTNCVRSGNEPTP